MEAPYNLWSTLYTLNTADLIIVYIISREVSRDFEKQLIEPMSKNEVL